MNNCKANFQHFFFEISGDFDSWIRIHHTDPDP